MKLAFKLWSGRQTVSIIVIDSQSISRPYFDHPLFKF